MCRSLGAREGTEAVSVDDDELVLVFVVLVLVPEYGSKYILALLFLVICGLALNRSFKM